MKKNLRTALASALAVPVLIGGLALPASAADSSIALPPPPPPKPAPTAPTYGIDGSYTKAKQSKITSSINALRARNAWLGATTGPIQFVGYKGGALRLYKGGAIVWNPANSTSYTLERGIRDAYLRQGGNYGGLGYPIANARGGLPNGGLVQKFAAGPVYWSSASGAHRIAWDYLWKKYGGLSGRLSYPTTDMVTVKATKTSKGGWYQKYIGGTIFLDSKGPGVQPVARVVYTR
jgi:uncharacterized protein with LGFP repeats